MALVTVNEDETEDGRTKPPVVGWQEAGRGAAPAAGREARRAES